MSRLAPARLGLALLLLAAPAAAQQPEYLQRPMVVTYDVGITMSDGARLSADVYRPAGEARHPAVFQLTPYNNNAESTFETAWNFVRQGLAFVSVDVRGRHDSEGTFDPFRNDAADGDRVLSWIGGQPWSDGQVATFGGSYLGGVQWLMARNANPHHRAMVSYVASADGFNDVIRWDGVPRLMSMATWMAMSFGRVMQPADDIRWAEAIGHLPLIELDRAVGRDVPWWQAWMRNDSLDAFWAPFQMRGHYERFDIPSFNVTGWWDPQLRSQVKNYMNAVATGGGPSDHVLVIGPWLHSANRHRQVGVRDHGPQAIIELDRLRDGWLTHRLLGRPRPADLPNVLYFLPVKNEWRTAAAFPVPGTRFTRFHLDSRGGANTLFGDGVLRAETPGAGPPDAYVYDPLDPVPTITSRTGRGGIPSGPVDNRAIETRQDVLVYTSEPLREGVEITGPVKAVIHFSADVPDTDIVVRLLDVDPSGRSLNLTKGIARAVFRDSFEHPRPLEPGRVYAIEVELYPTSNWFEAGHRIRVDVTSSDFPFFARNLNTGANPYTTSGTRPARVRIHHSAEHPSHIVLPVVPAAAPAWVAAGGRP